MNIILYFTVIFLILLFVYFIFNTYEDFVDNKEFLFEKIFDDMVKHIKKNNPKTKINYSGLDFVHSHPYNIKHAHLHDEKKTKTTQASKLNAKERLVKISKEHDAYSKNKSKLESKLEGIIKEYDYLMGETLGEKTKNSIETSIKELIPDYIKYIEKVKKNYEEKKKKKKKELGIILKKTMDSFLYGITIINTYDKKNKELDNIKKTYILLIKDYEDKSLIITEPHPHFHKKEHNIDLENDSKITGGITKFLGFVNAYIQGSDKKTHPQNCKGKKKPDLCESLFIYSNMVLYSSMKNICKKNDSKCDVVYYYKFTINIKKKNKSKKYYTILIEMYVNPKSSSKKETYHFKDITLTGITPYSCIKINRNYNQINEFIPDTYNYDFRKDSGIMKGIVLKDLTLGEVEYKNLKTKVDSAEKKKLIKKDEKIVDKDVAKIDMLSQREKKKIQDGIDTKKKQLETIIIKSISKTKKKQAVK